MILILAALNFCNKDLLLYKFVLVSAPVELLQQTGDTSHACAWKDSQLQTSMIFPNSFREIFKLPPWNTPLETGLIVKIHVKQNSLHCLSELEGGWREFVVNRNVLETAWITLLTPEEADNLSAAQQGWLNVTRQPNHLLI